jgi:hypothetical protein
MSASVRPALRPVLSIAAREQQVQGPPIIPFGTTVLV